MQYNQLKNGDSLLFTHGNYKGKMGCCDCGLVHDVQVQILKRKKVKITFVRNERSTGQRRRWQKIKIIKK